MPCVHPQLTQLGESLIGIPEVEVVSLPADATDETMAHRRRDRGEDVVMARRNQHLDIAAPAMGADRALGDHGSLLQPFCDQSDSWGRQNLAGASIDC